MQEPDDIALLREYAERASEDAFATLVARHINKIYSVALRHTANPHQAEEITQAVFVILAQKSRRLGQSIILEGWLYQTTCLTAMARVRSEIRRVRREQEAYMRSTLNEYESALWPQIAPLLDAAIANLGKTDRHAILLRFIYAKSAKDVGAALGLSEGAARVRLHRATDKLRQFFYKRGIVSTSELIAGAIATHSVQTPPIDLAKTIAAFALAKVPAASSSTLTLFKGAFKMMAWTQTKTTVVTGAILLLAVATPPIIIKEIRQHAAAQFPPIPRKTDATMRISGQFFGPGQLVDAGNVTPEAAWESRYWARAQGDYDAVIAGTEPQARETAKAWMLNKGTFQTRSKDEFASFAGFQILARKNLSHDKVELKYAFGFDADPSSTQTKIVVMVRTHGAWRCAETRPYEDNWDTGSQSEPES